MLLPLPTMASTALPTLPEYLSPEILLNPEKRKFPEFDVVRLLHTVFEPTNGCRVCVLIDSRNPQNTSRILNS